MVQISLLNQEERVGTILVAVAGGLSTVAVSILLLHMATVAIASPLKQLTSEQKLPRERVFLTTHLGYYLACFLISGLFGGIATLLEITWAQQGVILQDGRCSTQGIFLQLGEIGTATFSVIIAIHTMNNLVLRKRLPTSAVIFVVLLGWAFTLSLSVIGPFTSSNFYDIEGLWCWISISSPAFQVFTSIVPLLLSIILMGALYGAIYFKLRFDASDDDDPISLSASVAMSKDDYRRFLRPIAKKLFFYPAVYTILILPVTIVRLAALFDVSVPTYAIVIAAICDGLMGFANTVVYVTTRNVGPSISWDGVRTSAKGLLPSAITEPRIMLREQPSIEHMEKTRSAPAIGEARLVTTASPLNVQVVRASSSAATSVKVVRMHSRDQDIAEYSPSSEPEVDPAFVRKSGAIDSVYRWRERQGFQSGTSTPLPLSPLPNGMHHLRNSSSMSSLGFDRTTTPMIIPRYVSPSNDGSSVMSYQPYQPNYAIPDALRPRVPTPLSNRSNDWDAHSQASLISHIRNLSSTPSLSGSSVSSISNPRIPGSTRGANLPFVLYPDSGQSRTSAAEIPPEMVNANFSLPPSTSKPSGVAITSSSTRI